MKLLVFAFLLLSTAAFAHVYRADDGTMIRWYSKTGCCDGTDCWPVKAVSEYRKNGDIVVITEPGFPVLVPKKLERRPSKDHLPHVCAVNSPFNILTAHCYFVPGLSGDPHSKMAQRRHH